MSTRRFSHRYAKHRHNIYGRSPHPFIHASIASTQHPQVSHGYVLAKIYAKHSLIASQARKQAKHLASIMCPYLRPRPSSHPQSSQSASSREGVSHGLRYMNSYLSIQLCIPSSAPSSRCRLPHPPLLALMLCVIPLSALIRFPF